MKELTERFWSKVDKTPGLGFSKEYPDCWEWRGRCREGYGSLMIKGRDTKAHRFSYTLKYGEIGKGLIIRHLCNNRRCVKPGHLASGTYQDNANDKKDSDLYINGRRIKFQESKEGYSQLPVPECVDLFCSYDQKPIQALKTEHVYKTNRGIKEFFCNDECFKKYCAKKADELLPQRFWSRVEKGENPDDCWVWTGVKRKNGQGLIKFRDVTYSVNRLSWKWSNGDIPEDKVVCQSCLNNNCVNPKHLYLADSSASSKMLAGSSFSKLDQKKARKAIQLYKEGNTVYEIAEMFGCAVSTVSRLINAKYKSIISAPIETRNYQKGSSRYNSCLTEQEVISFKKDWDSCNYSLEELETKYKHPRVTLHMVASRRNWRHLEYPGSPWKNGKWISKEPRPTRSNAVLFDLNGEKLTLKQIHNRINPDVKINTLRYWINKGIPIQDIINSNPQ